MLTLGSICFNKVRKNIFKGKELLILGSLGCQTMRKENQCQQNHHTCGHLENANEYEYQSKSRAIINMIMLTKGDGVRDHIS